jgi:hypothetical protein
MEKGDKPAHERQLAFSETARELAFTETGYKLRQKPNDHYWLLMS